jgi:MGT family glycosyltransferase
LARYLLAASPLIGHVLPMLSIGADLRRRGHEVCLLTGAEFQHRVAGAGLGSAVLPPQTHVSPRLSSNLLTRLRVPAAMRRYLAGRAELRAVFVSTMLAQYRALHDLLGRQPVDAVLVDVAFTGALPLLLGADARPPVLVCGVGPLTLSSCDAPPFGAALTPDPTMDYTDLTRLVHRILFGGTQKRLNRALRSVDVDKSPVFLTDWPRLADQVLQLTVPSFEYPRRDLPSTVTFTGPILPDLPDAFDPPYWWHELNAGRKTVLVTQGTWDNVDLEQLIGPTLRALAGRDDVLVIATTGGGPQATLRRPVPANARLSEYIPYALLLPHIDVLVTNGGYGGVQHALRIGVPVVVAGESADKAEVAARAAYTGAGIDLRTARPTSKAVGAAVNRVLADDSYRLTTQRLRRDFAAATALDTIADIVMRTARRPTISTSADD